MRKDGKAFDPVSFVAGIAVMCLGTLLLLDRSETLDLDLSLLLPAVLATIGAILLVTGLTRGRKR